jgi:hypothetical protein
MRSISSAGRRLRTAAAVLVAAVTLVAASGATAPRPKPQATQVPLVVKVDDGFRWGDAAIGAAAGFGAALVLAGSLTLAGRTGRVMSFPQRRRRTQ